MALVPSEEGQEGTDSFLHHKDALEASPHRGPPSPTLTWDFRPPEPGGTCVCRLSPQLRCLWQQLQWTNIAPILHTRKLGVRSSREQGAPGSKEPIWWQSRVAKLPPTLPADHFWSGLPADWLH